MPARKLDLLALIYLLSYSSTLHAYIGPGAGAGTIAVVLGILLSVLMAFFAILWYPLKRFLRKRKTMKKNGGEVGTEKEAGED